MTFWMGLFLTQELLRSDRARSLLAFLVVLSVGVAVGAIWDVAEWGVDALASGDIIKGKLDIIMDTIGAAVAALGTRARVTRSGPQERGE